MSDSNLTIRRVEFAGAPLDRRRKVYEYRWRFQHNNPKVSTPDRVLYLHADLTPADMAMERFTPNE